MSGQWLRLLAGFALVGACVGVDGTGGAPGGAPGTVRGVVDYTGTLSGPLDVGVFTSFPPRGVPFAAVHIEAPMFPQPYVIRGVPEGRYFVLAIVDTDPTDGPRYHPTLDPGGAFGAYATPLSLFVDAIDGASDVDIELTDPSAASPWAGRSYR